MSQQSNTDVNTAPVMATLATLEAQNTHGEDVYQQEALVKGTTQQITAEDLAADRKLLRKIDWHVLPILFGCYGIQYMDKIGIASGVAFGLRTDLNLVGQQYAWLTTGFYIAYLIAEFPITWLMQRYPIDRVLAICCVWWGVCVFGMAACQDFKQIMALRVLLAIGEGAVLPGFMIITTAWYKKQEQHWRVQIMAMSNSVFSWWCLLVFYALGLRADKSGAIAGWRAINLFLGALSVTWAILVWFYLATPRNAFWLTKEEKARAHARLVTNQAGESESGIAINWVEVKEAFTDPMVWWSQSFSLCYCLSTGGVQAFTTIILQSFGLTGAQSIVYQIPSAVCQFTGLAIGGYICHRFQKKNVNLYVCMATCVPTLIGVFLQGLLTNEQKWGRISGYWIMGFYPVNIYVVWGQNGLNTAGRTKKSAVQAITFCVFAIGYLCGAQAFQTKDSPYYRPGLYFCAACYSMMLLIAIAWRIYTVRENARRDKIVAAMNMSPEEAELQGRLNGLAGMTDRKEIVENDAKEGDTTSDRVE